MKFSTRQDTLLPAADLFAAITHFDRIERMLVRRGVKVRRLRADTAPDAGTAWDMSFRLRGKDRALRMEVVRFDPPDSVVFQGMSEPVEIALHMTVIPLAPTRSRLVVEMEARPRNMRARLMIQTAKLGKAQLDRQFAQRIEGFVGDVTRQG